MGAERGIHEVGDRPLIQADLFNNTLPPSVPDRRLPPTPDEIEAWTRELPW